MGRMTELSSNTGQPGQEEDCSLVDIQEEVELGLRDGDYLLSIFVTPGETLSVDLERKLDGGMWRGDFTVRYLEEVTRRAGSYKNFTNFVKMLQSAMTPSRGRCSPAACVDLQVDVLTHRDLVENLKHPNLLNRELYYGSGICSIEKRYLILTYSNKFDLVHYSLPLLHEESFSEVNNGMGRLCMKPLRQRVAYMQACPGKNEACPKVFSRQQSEYVCPSGESKAQSDSDTKSGSRLSASTNACKVHSMEIRALNKKVQGLEDKLRSERMSLKKTISILSARNVSLEEDAKKARERELTLLSKISYCNFQISFLQGKVKSEGIIPSRSVSPAGNAPRAAAPSSRRRSSTSPRRVISPGLYTSSQACGPLPKRPYVAKGQRAPSKSPPSNILENRRKGSPNSRRNEWTRSSSSHARSPYGNIFSPSGQQTRGVRKISTFSSSPTKLYGQQQKFTDAEDTPSCYGRGKRFPLYNPPFSVREDRKGFNFSSPLSSPSSPSPSSARTAKLPSPQRSPGCQAPSYPSKSQASSPRRSSRGSLPPFVSRLTRSRSCPTISAREQEGPAAYSKRTTRPRPRPRPYSPTPGLLAAVQETEGNFLAEVAHQNGREQHNRSGGGVTSHVGRIDSRLYALQDYLHRIKLQ